MVGSLAGSYHYWCIAVLCLPEMSHILLVYIHYCFKNCTVAAQVTSEPRKFKKEVLEIHLLEHKDEADSEATSNEIEVHNVPENVTEKVLKTYFEVGKSGGCPGAVADCRKINEGTFIVTFHDPSGIDISYQCKCSSIHLTYSCSSSNVNHSSYIQESFSEFKVCSTC